MKNRKFVLYSVFVLGCLLLVFSCFSPWTGGEAEFTISLGGSMNGNRAAIGTWLPGPDTTMINIIEYMVTLKGKGTKTLTSRGGTAISGTVLPGTYDIEIKAMVDGERYAIGSSTKVEVKSGQPNIVQITMSKWLYLIGDTGPGGGIIFYYNPTGFTMSGGYGTAHYLEAAPAGWAGTLSDPDSIPWANSTDFAATNSLGTSTAIGAGRQNTGLIIANCPSNNTVAHRCRAYGPDWFLPSQDELTELYNLYDLKGKGSYGGLLESLYYSSTEVSATTARILAFNTGGPASFNKISGAPLVRPIRAF